MATQNFRVKNGLEVGTGVTISAGIVTANIVTANIVTATNFVGSLSGNADSATVSGYASTSGIATYASVSGVSSSVVGGAVSATSFRVDGNSSFYGNITVRDSYVFNIGDDSDLRFYNDGSNSYIEDTGFGQLYILGSDIDIKQHSTNKTFAKFIGAGSVELYFNDSKKFETTGYGATIFGTTETSQLNISGVSTFSGIATHTTSLFGTQASFSGIITCKTLSDASLSNYSEPFINIGNTGSSRTLGLSTSGYFIATLDQNTTFTFNSSGISTEYFGFAIQLKNGAGGPFSITWPVSVYWPDGGSVPSRTTISGRTDIWSFATTDGGTTWLGNLAILNYTV